MRNFVSISPEESLGGYRVMKEQCKIYGFKPKIIRYTESLENLLLCVETGVGVAVLDRNTRLEKKRKCEDDFSAGQCKCGYDCCMEEE